MSYLGLKNYKRFAELQPIEFNGITFLVGKNNAGKSTFVRALLLVLQYLKSRDLSKFSLNLDERGEVATSFERIKNQFSNLGDGIDFYFALNELTFSLRISALPEDRIANVHKLEIKDTKSGYHAVFSPVEKILDFSYDHKLVDSLSKEVYHVIDTFNKKIIELKSELEGSSLKKSSREYIDKLDEIEKHLYHISVVGNIPKQKDFSINHSFDEGKNSIWEGIHDFINESVKHFNENIQEGSEPDQGNGFERMTNQVKEIRGWINSVETKLGKFNFHYLSAYSIRQSALFVISDRNNELTYAIDDFYRNRILPGEPPYEFVRKWMRIFEVGDDFQISSHLNEAFEVKIISDNLRVDLADKGSGSIQIMLLLFRLASIIRFNKNEDLIPLLVIEEPEINLHPFFQSRLCDLFLEMYSEHHCQIIVETHSEYILRRSQVIVAESEFEIAPNENPFCVHYFPKEYEQMPYQLKYQPDGTFDKNFGTGFFDTASFDTLKLLRIKREKKV